MEGAARRAPPGRYVLGGTHASAGRHAPEGKVHPETLPDEEDEEDFDWWKFGVGVLSVAMMIGSIGMFVMYYFQKKEIDDKNKAMERIRSFMITRNGSWSTLGDAEILNEAVQLAYEVVNATDKVQEMDNMIDDIVKKIDEGWRAFNGSIYYIDPKETDFTGAQEECKRLNTILATVPSDDTETFLETLSDLSENGVWIALEMITNRWMWVSENLTFTTSYWADGRPNMDAALPENCVEIMKTCDRGKCWNNISCFKKRSAVCRMDPDPRMTS